MHHRINNNQQYPPPPSLSSNIVDNHNHNQQTTSLTQSSPTAISLEDFEKIVTKLRLIFPDCNPDYIRNCLQKEISSNPNKNYNDNIISTTKNAVNEGIRPELPSRHHPWSSPSEIDTGNETNRLKRLAISESNCRNLKNSSNNNSAGEEHIQKITEYITEYVGVWNKDFFEPRKIKVNFHEEKKENYIGYSFIIKNI
ncbi:1552_t:CDS:2 [Entrophospora sp. SA101]|nr:1552_t:CDS:2 [Entrophospora sp. SA101]